MYLYIQIWKKLLYEEKLTWPKRKQNNYDSHAAIAAAASKHFKK
jgi:hypothetical protein